MLEAVVDVGRGASVWTEGKAMPQVIEIPLTVALIASGVVGAAVASIVWSVIAGVSGKRREVALEIAAMIGRGLVAVGHELKRIKAETEGN